MKHFLTIVLCVILLGLMAGSVYGQTEIGGYFGYKYRLLDDADEAYAQFNINGMVNDKATAYLTMIISGTPRDFSADNFYVIYKEKYGTYTVGSFSHGSSNLLILGSAFGGLRSNIGVKFEYPCLEVLTLKYAFFHQEQVESNSYDAFALGCDYRFEKYFIGLNYIQPGVAPSGTETAGYTLNISVDPNPGSRIYFHHGRDKNRNLKGVIGYSAGFSKIPLRIALECSLIPVAENYNYGSFLDYEFSKNARLRYTFIAEGLTTTRNDLIAAFYF